MFLIVGAGVVSAFQIGKVPAALPALREDFGLGLIGAGWVLSIFNVIGIFAGMTLGAVIDRLGHRPMLLAGLMLIGAAGLLGAGASGAAMLCAARVLEGLGFTIVVVGGPGLLTRVATHKDLRLAFGFWGAYMPAGMAIMLVLSPSLIERVGWRGLWVANAALAGLFALVLAVGTRRVGRTHAGASGWSGFLVTLKARGPWLLALAFAAYTAQFMAIMGFLPIILTGEAGLAPATAAALTAIAVAVNAPGALLGGWLLTHGWPRGTLIQATSIAMAVSTLVIYAPIFSFGWHYAGAVLFSLVCGLLPTSVLSGAASHAPKPTLIATTNGLIMQGSNLGQSIGPPAVAAVATATGGWAWSPAVLISLAVICLLFGRAIQRMEDAAAETA